MSDFSRRLLALIAIGFAVASAAATGAEGDGAFERSPLARAAAQLQPGEFQPFETKLPEGVEHFSELLRGSRPNGSTAPDIDTWTDSGQWDPQRKRAFFQGLRQSNRFLAYDGKTNTWREIGLDKPEAPPRFERFGHLYGRTALDWKRGHFYRLAGNTLHRYLIDEDRWEKVENCPIGGYISIDWHYGLDMLVGVSGRQVHGFRDGRWTFLGEAAVHGYHSSAKFNPKRRDMLFIGGNHSRNKVDILTAEGRIRHMRDAPFLFSISSDNLTHDPVTGNYLVLHRDRILWEYDPDLDEWRVARDMSRAKGGWPFAPGGLVPFVIDELGVILWNQGRTAILYRHASAFSGPAAQASRPPAEDAPALVASPAAPPVAPSPSPAPPKAAPQRSTAAKPAKEGPTPATATGTESIIEREARKLEPGEWRNLAHLTTWPGKDKGRSFKAFQYLLPIGGKGRGGADGMGWTQNLVYHKGKLMMLLMRDHLERALMVMEPDGRFWRLNQPEGFDQKTHRRPFNKLTQDDKYLYYSPNIGRENLGRMIRTPLDDPGVFESYGIPIGDSDILGQFAATYVPEWRRFYAYTPGGKVWSWAEGETAWTRHGEMPRDENGLRLSGYAGLLVWNPVRKELVIVGGQNFGRSKPTSHKAYRIAKPLGPIEMLEDRRYPDGQPMPWGSGSSKLIVDPRDGSYIVYRRGFFYRNNCAGGRFQVYEDVRESLPFGQYEPYAPLALVPGTDVVVFLSHIKGLVLHRLKPVAGDADAARCKAESLGSLDAAPGPAAPSQRRSTGEASRLPGSPQTPLGRNAPGAAPDDDEGRGATDGEGTDKASDAASFEPEFPSPEPGAGPARRSVAKHPPSPKAAAAAAAAPAPSARHLTSADIRALRAVREARTP